MSLKIKDLEPKTKLDDLDVFVVENINGKTNKVNMKSITNQIISEGSGLSYIIVETLPETDIDIHKVYLVPNHSEELNNYYDEYMYINNVWEKIGNTKIDATIEIVTLTLDDENNYYIADKNINAIKQAINEGRNVYATISGNNILFPYSGDEMFSYDYPFYNSLSEKYEYYNYKIIHDLVIDDEDSYIWRIVEPNYDLEHKYKINEIDEINNEDVFLLNKVENNRPNKSYTATVTQLKELFENTELPIVDASNNGSILQVIQGEWGIGNVDGIATKKYVNDAIALIEARLQELNQAISDLNVLKADNLELKKNNDISYLTLSANNTEIGNKVMLDDLTNDIADSDEALTQGIPTMLID